MLSFVGFVVGVQFQQMKTCIFTFVGLGSPFFFQQMKEKEARNRISKAVLHLCPQNSKTTNVKSKKGIAIEHTNQKKRGK